MSVKRSVRLLRVPKLRQFFASVLHFSREERDALGRASSLAFLNSFFPSLPRGRTKLLRRNDDHPSWNRCKGGRLHHLPLPQWGLVEAGAVRPAGVPQRPDAVLDGLRRG